MIKPLTAEELRDITMDELEARLDAKRKIREELAEEAKREILAWYAEQDYLENNDD